MRGVWRPVTIHTVTVHSAWPPLSVRLRVAIAGVIAIIVIPALLGLVNMLKRVGLPVDFAGPVAVVLGVAVLLDAALVRLLLLPVLMRLTGRSAWYVPAWLRRVLPNVTFSH